MAPFQGPAGTGVIESFGRATIRPADQREILAGMLRMTVGAALLPHAAMESARALDEPGNLFVTARASRGHLFLAPPCPADVTLHALQRAFQALVRTCEWARRYLRAAGCGSCESQNENHDRSPHHSQVAPSATTTTTCTSTATSAAIATGRWNTCQYRKTACVASSIRACWANATS